MKKTLFAVALVAALGLGTLSADAACPLNKGPEVNHQQFGYHHHKQLTPEQKAKMEQRKAEIDKRLGITAEQKEQLKAIHEKSKAEIAPKIKELTELEHELSVINQKEYTKNRYNINSLENVKLSGKSVDQLKKEIQTLKQEIKEIRKANFEASQKVFTEEQKNELKKMKEERIKEMKKHGKHFGHKPPMHPMW